MDIMDIMLARAMTPQGKTETYLAKANAAAAKAAKAEQDAAAAIATVEAAAEEIATAKDNAADLLKDAQDALETAQSAQINMPELYTTTGQNTDGSMTQKAITDALGLKANKTYVDQQIAAIPTGGGSGGGISNLGPENAQHLVTIGSDGNIIASTTTENELIEALIRIGVYHADAALGLEINYAEKTFTRTQGAFGLSMGSDFDSYVMYGGRKRCNVADDGTINAFYGEQGYTEDGSNGQVMVYQPKFYYQRTPLVLEELTRGKAIRRESLIISSTNQSGFKLHPLFDLGNGEELDYVLLPAYDGTIVNDKMASIAGAKPVASINITAAEEYATARGTGWHIMNMAAESAQQMLEIVEFGSMNGQTSLEPGICNLSASSGSNCASITGSTSSLGNATGHATSTIGDVDGTQTTYTDAGQRAISYRGMENPWGNIWHFVGGINIKGDGQSQGGTPYICTDFNYTPKLISSNYEDIGFNLPSVFSWISAMGYGNSKYDWVFMPIECSNANSALPVGDNLWTIANAPENKIVVIGGSCNHQDAAGPFYYACDRSADSSSRTNYGARIMFIPTKNDIYELNINKWTTLMGG